MKHLHTKSVLLSALALALSTFSIAQDACILKDAGKLYKKQERKPSPVMKTRYQFGVGQTSGREYLMQQDLFDSKGNPKSSGQFSEDGNKSADIRYTFEANGKLQKRETKYIGKNLKEVVLYNANARPEKREMRTKGDTLLTYTVYAYDDQGFPVSEEDFRGEKSLGKKLFEDKRSSRGDLIETCHYALDSTGARVPGQYPLTVNEFDDQGTILQTTVYNNKERRKMLSWVYFKYQLDNDYRIIRRHGYNEDQQETERVELVYTDSSITSTYYKVCACPEKKLENKGRAERVYNSFGEIVREIKRDASGLQTEVTTWRYDDFGLTTEVVTVKSSEPEKLIKSRTIIEYYTDVSVNAPVSKAGAKK
jgi:hypothetical protein